jgi:alpha-tubulin suppressor-like RCC1 family protein
VGNTAFALPASLAACKQIAAITGGRTHAAALLSNGSVIAWDTGATGSGGGEYGQGAAPDLALQGRTAVALAAGDNFTVALLDDGSVLPWGDARWLGPSGVPVSAGQPLTSVAVGSSHMLGIATDGTLVGAGSNEHGQLNAPDELAGKRLVQVAAGAYFSLALTADGFVHAWGDDVFGQVGGTCLGVRLRHSIAASAGELVCAAH